MSGARLRQLVVDMSRHARNVLAVILNWRGSERTIACALSLQAGSLTPDILIVDNGSGTSDVDRLRSLTDGVREIIALERNLGFAAGMNVGIRYAVRHKYDFVWLLNNDTLIDHRC